MVEEQCKRVILTEFEQEEIEVELSPLDDVLSK